MLVDWLLFFEFLYVNTFNPSYVIAIVSNQAGLNLATDPKTPKSDLKRVSDFKAKAAAVFNQLNLPISLYAATGKDQYRKPRVGMWETFRQDYGLEGADAIDLSKSIFVGDAGGRTGDAAAGVTKDHSCSDRYDRVTGSLLASLLI
jgi:bifunctional polynucleotide phosphatase/kinase